MPGKPKYVLDLENSIVKLNKDVDKIKSDLKENKDAQDNILFIQGETLKKLNNIGVCLAGTEYDKNDHNRGIVSRVHKLEHSCEAIKTWKTKITTINTVIWVVASAVITFLASVVIANWKDIFDYGYIVLSSLLNNLIF